MRPAPSPTPAAAPPSGVAPTSTHREAAVFLVWGAGIILAAHGVEVLSAGRTNWLALGIRVVWAALLMGQAVLLRRARYGVILAGVVVVIFGSALLDLCILAVTGRSASPLLWFSPVLATVMPFMAFDVVWVGLAGSAVLVAGTALMLVADGAPLASHVALANAGGGALACGWLLARVYERARRAEEARRLELAEAMASIKTLNGLLPVCAWCHRVRTDQGYWEQIEAYVSRHSDATFTHSLCQDCFHERYGDEDEERAP
jgi:hypothetical protein